MDTNGYFPKIKDIEAAESILKEVIEVSPLQRNASISDKYGADIYLKREDLQIVRSYKIRGAYNKIRSLDADSVRQGIVCASAGNHAQGVAFSCDRLKIKGTVYMPATTPRQKIDQVMMFGRDFIDIVLTGDTFDTANKAAVDFAENTGKTFIPPFDDEKIIEGQGTIAMEILGQMIEAPDFIFVPIGGGGLASGVGAYIKQISPATKIIGVEPAGAPCMKAAMDAGRIVELDKINKFVDGAAVKKAGRLTYNICRDVLDDIITVPEGAVCSTIIAMYNKSAIVVEPAGALSVAALGLYAGRIKGKTVVCIISGSNNDIARMQEIQEKSLLYEGLKHYFIVNFPQRAGSLFSFTKDVLGPNVDLTHFQYTKKINKEEGPALIGIEVADKKEFDALLRRMDEHGIKYEYINENNQLFEFLI